MHVALLVSLQHSIATAHDRLETTKSRSTLLASYPRSIQVNHSNDERVSYLCVSLTFRVWQFGKNTSGPQAVFNCGASFITAGKSWIYRLFIRHQEFSWCVRSIRDSSKIPMLRRVYVFARYSKFRFYLKVSLFHTSRFHRMHFLLDPPCFGYRESVRRWGVFVVGPGCLFRCLCSLFRFVRWWLVAWLLGWLIGWLFWGVVPCCCFRSLRHLTSSWDW